MPTIALPQITLTRNTQEELDESVRLLSESFGYTQITTGMQNPPTRGEFVIQKTREWYKNKVESQSFEEGKASIRAAAQSAGGAGVWG